MGYIVNVGEININEEVSEEAMQLINNFLGCDTAAEAGSDVLVFEEYYDKYFDETLQELFEKLKPYGYIFNGTVGFYGDWEGRTIIENNEIYQIDRNDMAIMDASDQELIYELERRGYIIAGKREQS